MAMFSHYDYTTTLPFEGWRARRLQKDERKQRQEIADSVANGSHWNELIDIAEQGLSDNPCDVILKRRYKNPQRLIEKIVSDLEWYRIPHEDFSYTHDRWQGTVEDFTSLDLVKFAHHGVLEERHRMVFMREALNRDAESWRIVEDLASLGLYESQRRQIFYRAVLAKRWTTAMLMFDQGLDNLPPEVLVEMTKNAESDSMLHAMLLERGLQNSYFISNICVAFSAEKEEKERDIGKSFSEKPLQGNSADKCSTRDMRTPGKTLSKRTFLSLRLGKVPKPLRYFTVGASVLRARRNERKENAFTAAEKIQSAGSDSDSDVPVSLENRDESGRKAAKVIRSDEKSQDGVSAKKTQKKKNHKEDSERKARVETAISEGAKCGDWLLVMTVYEGRLGEDVKLLVLDEAVRQNMWHVVTTLIRHDPEAHVYRPRFKQLIPVALERRQWSVLEAMVVRGVSPDDVDTVYREALTHRRWSLLAALVKMGLSDVMTHAAIHQALKCNEWTFIVEYLKSNLSSHDELCAVVEQAVEQGSWPLVAAILTPDIPDCLMSKALVKSTKSGNDLVAETCIKIASGCRSSPKEGSARAAGKYSDVIHAADEDGSTVVQLAAR
ncbi:hypothetical protein BaRGS_00017605 [Batillaria attramentaria]|uniref:Uncharacterized protein n=1 Tax=Batillaria attramentaria TaxID=370345 RepID=A0ABD0KV63_9CAEN